MSVWANNRDVSGSLSSLWNISQLVYDFGVEVGLVRVVLPHQMMAMTVVELFLVFFPFFFLWKTG